MSAGLQTAEMSMLSFSSSSNFAPKSVPAVLAYSRSPSVLLFGFAATCRFWSSRNCCCKSWMALSATSWASRAASLGQLRGLGYV
eukprot:6985654-Pyramimonas_sp.AAC.1